MLGEKDLVKYLKTHALMYEYYRQTQEIVPVYIGVALDRLFTSEAYQIVNTRYAFPFHTLLLILLNIYLHLTSKRTNIQ